MQKTFFTIIILSAIQAQLFGATTTVTNTASSGPGSLFDAVLFANANPGTDILFNIPPSDPGYDGTRWTIGMPHPLPNITGDGTRFLADSQPTYSGSPVINVKDTTQNYYFPFRVYADNLTFRALCVRDTGYVAITLGHYFDPTRNANNVTIEDCEFLNNGVNLDWANGSGIQSFGTTDTVISNCYFEGNYESGVTVENTNYGITSVGTKITGCVFNDTSAGGAGSIFVRFANDIELTDNVIMNGNGHGIHLLVSENVSINDCMIGDSPQMGIFVNWSNQISIEQSEVYGSQWWGVGVAHGIDVTVAENEIHDNQLDGVGAGGITIQGLTISQNSIYGNAELGIDLNVDGVTLNDPGDGDTGPNGLLNFPTVVDGTIQGNLMTVSGTSAPGNTVEVFASSDDPSGYGEGEEYLATAVADTSGNFSVQIDRSYLPITTTATDVDGNTSEFSETITPSVSIGIDVKPGGSENPINLKSKGKLPVAILSDAGFDATEAINIELGDPLLPGTVTPVKIKSEDVDGDGDIDLLLHFSTKDLVSSGAIDASSTSLMLSATTTDGISLYGTDTIVIVPK